MLEIIHVHYGSAWGSYSRWSPILSIGAPRSRHFRRPCDFRVRTKKETRRVGSFGLQSLTTKEVPRAMPRRRRRQRQRRRRGRWLRRRRNGRWGRRARKKERKKSDLRVVPPRRTAMVAAGKLAACLKRPLTSVKIYSPSQQNKPLIRDSARVHLYAKRKRNPKSGQYEG